MNSPKLIFNKKPQYIGVRDHDTVTGGLTEEYRFKLLDQCGEGVAGDSPMVGVLSRISKPIQSHLIQEHL